MLHFIHIKFDMASCVIILWSSIGLEDELTDTSILCQRIKKVC